MTRLISLKLTSIIITLVKKRRKRIESGRKIKRETQNEARGTSEESYSVVREQGLFIHSFVVPADICSFGVDLHVRACISEKGVHRTGAGQPTNSMILVMSTR